jgi:hypothetical protein
MPDRRYGMKSIPEKIEFVLSGVDDELFVRKPSDEQWCVQEVIGHIIETDKASKSTDIH